jgi:3-deoxy-manno-octulosonate cytidylyltransferase (CMP-KDO synthetase)
MNEETPKQLRVLGVIPARYASSRLEGKPLLKINGKPMVQRVYEQGLKAISLTHVVVATDDRRIFNVVRDFGGDVVMTSSKHISGTDRCAEVLDIVNEPYDIIVNIQGDEPIIKPEQINTLIACFGEDTTDIATLIKRIENSDELFNPNKVKVVMNRWKEAMYFSRNPIPYCRTAEPEKWLQNFTYFKHIGMYAFRRSVLKLLTSLPPTTLELTESLEQLRWLENGYNIKTIETDWESPNIDTAEDLEFVNKHIDFRHFD